SQTRGPGRTGARRAARRRSPTSNQGNCERRRRRSSRTRGAKTRRSTGGRPWRRFGRCEALLQERSASGSAGLSASRQESSEPSVHWRAVFDALSDRLGVALGDLRKRGKLDEESISRALREIRLALL